MLAFVADFPSSDRLVSYGIWGLNKLNLDADIDDQIPTYPDGTLMCMSTGVKRVLWPALLEKAVRT